MIYFEDGEWKICNNLVAFNNRGKAQEKYTDNPDRYKNLNEKHDEFEDLQIEEVDWENEILERLEKINEHNIPDGYRSILIRYLKNGELKRYEDNEDKEEELVDIPGDHPLAVLK